MSSVINKAAYDTLKSMQSANWQEQIRTSIKSPETLLKHLDICSREIDLSVNSLRHFPVKVPLGFVDRMQKGNPADPLLRQVLPLAAEDEDLPHFSSDPVGELARRTGTGILHKYHGRALLITTGACAIHCRYCFRRHFPYEEEHTTGNWGKPLEYLGKDTSIKEIILSGGDPLALSDTKLLNLINRLAAIPAIKRLRIHSRIPVVIPARVTDDLVQVLSQSRLTPIAVIHCNHPGELDERVGDALIKLRNAGIVVLNQSVMLKGVNDDWNTIAALCERLIEYGVLPYYLHMLDPVAGAAHFNVPDEAAGTIMEDLRIHLPGFLVPRLVREQAGAPYKIPIL